MNQNQILASSVKTTSNLTEDAFQGFFFLDWCFLDSKEKTILTTVLYSYVAEGYIGENCMSFPVVFRNAW